MLTLDGSASAAVSAAVRGVAWLVQLEFTTGTLYLTTAPQSFLIDGNTYVGLGSVGNVSPVHESEDTDTEQITLSLSVVDQAMIAATLGSVETYRGRRVRLALQLFTETFQPTGAPVWRWVGVMDRVAIVRDRSETDGGDSSGRIEMLCSRVGMDRARTSPGLRLSHAQQIAAYPGDLGMEYMAKMLEQPALWLTKRFQRI